MATSKDHGKSVLADFDEVRGVYCEPCLNDGNLIIAERFCIDCSEYLCEQCCKIHIKFKAFKHHVLQDNDKMSLDSRKSRAQDVCVEKCAKHPTKIVEYFCFSCDMLGCSACITVSHRQCENVDHIPDIAKNFHTSEEYKTVLSELERKDKAIKNSKEKIQFKTNMYYDIKKRGKAELRRQRDEINTFFDHIEADMDRRMGYINKANKQYLKFATHTTDLINDDLSKIKTKVKSKQEAEQNCELFIAIKQSKQNFDKLDKRFEKLTQDSRIQPFYLAPSNQIQNIKENTTEICRLRTANIVTKIDVSNFRENDSILMKRLATVQTCFLALLECDDKVVKVIDARNTQVVGVIALKCTYVWRLTNVNSNQIAVLISSDYQSKIQLLSVDLSGHISKDTEIELDRKFRLFRSFIFKGGKFFMVGFKEIVILDKVGNHLETFSTRFATDIGIL
ncbi:uncharacterized protein LOC132747601 [Ruditapes philippinarum]|uniref:uncharacterized protein LOC132747601 n=1 Tax=Ruditapes philippinarum TaxID=129788 RepID=UPI00295C1ECA|nr:uncharacterized protein LOC132747601 [Ruditapes philippinarum]